MITGHFKITEEIELVNRGGGGGEVAFLGRSTIAPWHLTRAIHEAVLPVIDWPVWLLHAVFELNHADLAIVVHVLADGRLLVENGRAAIVACSIGNVAAAHCADASVIKFTRGIVQTCLMLV